MRETVVEILSDQTNAAVMRHPDRQFPGVLIQGDSLSGLCRDADELCELLGRNSEHFEEANLLRNKLQSYLVHYKSTLLEHDIPLPFSDR
ncbi:DUF6959 family protein [Hyphococcus sp.]|uniref:DUF6959 family protein n=1 Tax=Hyphococcus sp. TaxID=2038636 RepID=UPI0035C6A29F